MVSLVTFNLYENCVEAYLQVIDAFQEFKGILIGRTVSEILSQS